MSNEWPDRPEESQPNDDLPAGSGESSADVPPESTADDEVGAVSPVSSRPVTSGTFGTAAFGGSDAESSSADSSAAAAASDTAAAPAGPPPPSFEPKSSAIPVPPPPPTTTLPKPKKAPAPKKPKAPGVRKVHLSLTRVDPLSVMKLAFLLSVAIGIMLVIAVAVFWTVLDQLEVFTKIDEFVRTVMEGSATQIDILEYVAFGRVISGATLIAVFDVFVLTALATIMALLYNVTAALVGGIHLTLADE